MLENEALIEPTAHGAITTEQTADFLDHHTDRLADVIDQLDALSASENTA